MRFDKQYRRGGFRNNPFGRKVFLGLILLIFTSCGDTPRATNVVPSQNTVTPQATIAFPKQRPTPSNQPRMAAQLGGTLMLRDGCLRVTSRNGADYLILWPAEATLQFEQGTIHIATTNGRIISQVGESIILGGGESSSSQELSTPERARLLTIPPSNCSGPYWVAHFIEL